MKKFKIKLFFTSAAIILILIATAGVCLASYDLKEYFPLGEADVWKYTVTEEGSVFEESCKAAGKEAVQQVDTTVILCKSEVSGVLEESADNVSIDSGGLKIYKSREDKDIVNFSEPIPLYPALEIGSTKQFQVVLTVEDYDTKDIKESKKLSGNVKLAGLEDVEVVAGKFIDCLKFVSYYEEATDDGLKTEDYECTSWLAPGVGKVKEFCFYSEYGSDQNKDSVSTILSELSSAVINGNKISRESATK
ncbi:MAG: hypothetical protein FJZ15_04875 [Candidatus Omnitrophica bacterium]|nr:hypothetical protein [Candidatus Omnitrophota bacterium]